MELPKFLRRKTKLQKESDSAVKYLNKLWALKITKIILFSFLFMALAPVVVFFLLRPKRPEKIYYGVTFSKKYSEQMGLDWKEVYINILDDLKVKNLRLIAYWDEIETSQDVYNYEDIKWQISEAEKRNANVILALGRKVPRYPECFEPRWWKEIENETYKNIEVYDYVKTTVNELSPYKSIKMWQVENEPFWPFGECDPDIERKTVLKEVAIVRQLDDRPIIVQDSGEGGFWYPTYSMGDYLGISMYRKIWYDFWGFFMNRFVYFKYPLAHWSYKIKADFVRVPHEKIIVTELQAEPWGPAINSELNQREKDQTMSRNDFMDTILYAQKAGFKDIYFWGVEWWYFEMVKNNNPFFWNAAKTLIN